MANCSKCGIFLTPQNCCPSCLRKHDCICHSCLNKRSRRWDHSHKEQLLIKRREQRYRWRCQYPEWRKKCREKVKREVLEHYGGNPPKCACCGESHFEFLTIDHMNGGGHKERTRLGREGVAFYFWLRKNGYPKGYQVLCMNCNWAKGKLGICPHQRECF